MEGKALGEAKVTLRLLNRRCGPFIEATTAQIQALPLGQLEALADALLDFHGPDDLVAWLFDARAKADRAAPPRQAGPNVWSVGEVSDCPQDLSCSFV